jgi:hypothetical protein
VCVPKTRDRGPECIPRFEHPADVIDAIGIPKWGDGVANVRQEFVGTLVMLEGIHLRLGAGISSGKACADPCCYRHRYGIEMQEFPRIPLSIRREALACTGGACERTQCPAWLPKEQDGQILVGRFLAGHPLTFDLDTNPWQQGS